MPPVNIKVRDHRTFGRKPVIGRHVIKSIDFDAPPAVEPAAEPSMFYFILLLGDCVLQKILESDWFRNRLLLYGNSHFKMVA